MKIHKESYSTMSENSPFYNKIRGLVKSVLYVKSVFPFRTTSGLRSRNDWFPEARRLSDQDHTEMLF